MAYGDVRLIPDNSFSRQLATLHDYDNHGDESDDNIKIIPAIRFMTTSVEHPAKYIGFIPDDILPTLPGYLDTNEAQFLSDYKNKIGAEQVNM